MGDLVRLQAGRPGRRRRRGCSAADGLALDESILTGRVASRSPRGAGEAVWSGSFVVEGAGRFEVDGGRPRQPREQLAGDGARVPPPALAARAGASTGCCSWLVGLSRSSARSLGYSLLASRRRASHDARRDRDRRRREPRARGADPAHQPHLPRGGAPDGPARRARAAAQRDRVARVGRRRLHRQDRHAHRADAARGRARARPRAWSRAALERALGALRRQRAGAQRARSQAIAEACPAAAGAALAAQVPFSSRRRWSALDLGDETLVLGAPERFAARRRCAGRPPSGSGRGPARAGARRGPRRRCRRRARCAAAARTCGRSASSCSPSGCARRGARPSRSSPSEGVELKVLSGDAPRDRRRDRPRRRRRRSAAGARRRRAARRRRRRCATSSLRRAVVGRDLAGGQARGRRRRSRTPGATSRWSATASTTCPR